jgi:hypothetical protein
LPVTGFFFTQSTKYVAGRCATWATRRFCWALLIISSPSNIPHANTGLLEAPDLGLQVTQLVVVVWLQRIARQQERRVERAGIVLDGKPVRPYGK